MTSATIASSSPGALSGAALTSPKRIAGWQALELIERHVRPRPARRDDAGIDGMEVLKRDPPVRRSRSLPVIMVTANRESDDHRRGAGVRGQRLRHEAGRFRGCPRPREHADRAQARRAAGRARRTSSFGRTNEASKSASTSGPRACRRQSESSRKRSQTRANPRRDPGFSPITIADRPRQPPAVPGRARDRRSADAVGERSPSCSSTSTALRASTTPSAIESAICL